MSGQHSDYFGATPYYSPNLSSQSMSGYGTNVHSNNYPPQAQGSASSSQYTSSAYQVPTTPKQAPPRSSQHSTPQGRLPVPSKGSSSRGTSSSKYKPRQPHKCDDPSKRYTCKRKERSLLGFCQQGSCWNQQSPRSTHLCEKHLLQQRENKRNFRENHARENKCASCTADVVPGRTACEKHLEKRLEYIKKSRGVKETARTAKSQPKISDPQRTNYSQSQGEHFHKSIINLAAIRRTGWGTMTSSHNHRKTIRFIHRRTSPMTHPRVSPITNSGISSRQLVY